MKDNIGINFEKVILKCFDKNRDKNNINRVIEEEWIRAIWRLLPLFNIFIYSKKKTAEDVEKWFKDNVLKGGYPFRIEIIKDEKSSWSNLVVGITDKEIKAIATIGKSIKFNNWEDIMMRLYAIY